MIYRKSILQKIKFLRKSIDRTEAIITNNLKIIPSVLEGLNAISEGEILSNKEFSVRINVGESRGSKVIMNMQKSGFIKLMKIFGDSRYKNIALTKSGIKLQKKADNILMRTEREIYKKVNAKEIEVFLKVCECINELLKETENSED